MEFNKGMFNNNFNMENNGPIRVANIVFYPTTGYKRILNFVYGTTINDILERYLKDSRTCSLSGTPGSISFP